MPTYFTGDYSIYPVYGRAPPMREGGRPPSWADLRRFAWRKVSQRKHTIQYEDTAGGYSFRVSTFSASIV